MASDSKSIYKLISKDGTNPKQEFELTQTEIIIGRDPGADIILSTAVVSRRHARFTRQGEDYIIEDLGSSNGTFVNDRKLDQPFTLKSGDQIRLGQTTRLIYEISPIRVFEPPSGVAETVIGEEIPIASLGSSAQLVVTIAGDNARTYNLKQSEISIGRAEDNDIVIPSRIISGYHVVLNQVDNRYQITTLPGAKNPVYLNGRAISKPTILENGEILRIGGRDPGVMVTMVYELPGEPDTTNRLTVVGRGDRFTIYNNDTLIGEVNPSDPPPQPNIPAPPVQPEDLEDARPWKNIASRKKITTKW